MHINEGKGKLALFSTKDNVLLNSHPSYSSAILTSLTLLLRHYELTNENVSYFLTNQSKTRRFIDFKVTRKPKTTKNIPYLYEIPAHFNHEIKTKGYDVIGVNLFYFNDEIPLQKEGLTGAPYTTGWGQEYITADRCLSRK